MKATKLIPEIKEYCYEKRLKILKLPSLKYRQTRNDLMQTFKIIHGIDNLNANNFYKFSNSNTRNNKSKARTIFTLLELIMSGTHYLVKLEQQRVY